MNGFYVLKKGPLPPFLLSVEEIVPEAADPTGLQGVRRAVTGVWLDGLAEWPWTLPAALPQEEATSWWQNCDCIRVTCSAFPIRTNGMQCLSPNPSQQCCQPMQQRQLCHHATATLPNLPTRTMSKGHDCSQLRCPEISPQGDQFGGDAICLHLSPQNVPVREMKCLSESRLQESEARWKSLFISPLSCCSSCFNIVTVKCTYTQEK